MGVKVAQRGLAQSKRVSFPDKNLQMALLDAVHDSYLWLQEQEAKYESARGSHPTWPTWAAIRSHRGEEHIHNQALEQYLLEIDVLPSQLSRLQSLTLHANRDLFSWVYEFWWHDGDHFVVHDLSGIENCTGLEQLILDSSLVKSCSLRPLQKLDALHELELNLACEFQDIEYLLKIPNLKKLDVVGLMGASEAELQQWDPVLNKLCEQGLQTLSRR